MEDQTKEKMKEGRKEHTYGNEQTNKKCELI